MPLHCVSGLPKEVEEGACVKGLVTGVRNQLGLAIQLQHGFKGHVALPDISDTYKDDPTDGFYKNQFVQCYVIHCDKKKKEKCSLSLRKSRFVDDLFVTRFLFAQLPNAV